MTNWFMQVATVHLEEFKKRYMHFVEGDSDLLGEYKTRSALLNVTLNSLYRCEYVNPKPLWYQKALADYKKYKDRVDQGNYELISPSDEK